MIAAQIDDVDAAVISNLIDGLDILQIGCHQGHDTAALARSAARVVTIGQCPGLEHTGFSDQAAMWWTIQRFYHVADHTLLLRGEVFRHLHTFAPGQFDVAVIDMRASGAYDPDHLAGLLRILANKVIVIPAASTVGPTWSGVMKECGYRFEQVGRLWVFDQVPAETENETKEGS